MEGLRTENRDFKKMRAWEQAKRGAAVSTDGRGLEIDGGIRETVVAFNVSGLPTDSSCEGHFGWGLLCPWVGFSAPGEPKERFEGEDEAARLIAEKYGITEEDVRYANNEEAYDEWRLLVHDREETAEYKKWQGENMKLARHAEDLLSEFYSDHTPPAGMRLVANDYGWGIRIHADSEYAAHPLPKKEYTEDEKQGYLAIQEEARTEMHLFTKFLRERYFSV